MPRSDALQELLFNKESYSFHKIEGLPAVLRKDIIVEDTVATGDKIELFHLPNGKYFVTKAISESECAFTVGKITPAHIYFDDEITLKER